MSFKTFEQVIEVKRVEDVSTVPNLAGKIIRPNLSKINADTPILRMSTM